MLARFYSNHVFANLTFILIVIAGTWAYTTMPREQNPDVTFNWVQITTLYPGATAEDIEKLVTEPLEDGVRKVKDIRMSSSTSSEGVSMILVRFHELESSVYDKRITDLRREIQSKYNDELPDEVEEPEFFELTSANMFPTAMILVSGAADDDLLRSTAQTVHDDLEGFPGIDSIIKIGLREPELQIEFSPERLRSIGSTPIDLADTVAAHFTDVAAGTVEQKKQQWLVRMSSLGSDPRELNYIPLKTAVGLIPISSVASISRDREKASQLVSSNGLAGVEFEINKKNNVSSLQLLEDLKNYIAERNRVTAKHGITLTLVDDQTPQTAQALEVMQNNALLGLILVMLSTWLFLGARLSFFIGIGILFTLCGTFLTLHSMGETLNISVFLGIVIALGMLVDDAVVVVESISYRLQRGIQSGIAVIQGLQEVASPVFTSVLTTISAFVPLLLTPGVLGQFMFVIPLVVTIALLVSLVEAFWMLPAHISIEHSTPQPSKLQRLRLQLNHKLRIKYSFALIWVLRHSKLFLFGVLCLFALTGLLLAKGAIKTDFFAADPIRLFYVNVEMPGNTPLKETLSMTEQVERTVKRNVSDDELRHAVSYSGRMFTGSEVLTGDQYGQVVVSLKPQTENRRHVDEVIESMRKEIENIPGPLQLSFTRITGGPPVTKPINIKVRSDNLNELRGAVTALTQTMEQLPGVRDITNDDTQGELQLNLKLDGDAISRAGLDPANVNRIVRLLVDGEIVASMHDQGHKLNIRVKAKDASFTDIKDLLRHPIALPDGGEIALEKLVTVNKTIGQSAIKHYKLRRSITVEADIDKLLTDTVTVNQQIKEKWETLQINYPTVNLDFSGVFEDIQESMQALALLFILGIGIIYLILGTQFCSYWQPFLILFSIPLAFISVLVGLFVSQNPLSLYTMYGSIALGGIAVNSAIALIVACNDRIKAGMSLTHATVYAARRRLIPILITALTTIAGLFSLATGLGGHSLLWGPVASAIVWGLGGATFFTLFLTPLLFKIFNRPKNT